MDTLYEDLFGVISRVPGLCGEQAGWIARVAEMAALQAQRHALEGDNWTPQEILEREG